MLKILTLNLNDRQDGLGPWGERCARVRALIQGQRPAIVALQAVHADSEQDPPRGPACGLNRHHSLLLAADTKHPHQGSAILSEIPLSAPGPWSCRATTRTRVRGARSARALAGRWRAGG